MAKDVALVLLSGGARGLAHIGAIEELEARGYHITSIAGCSMGSLIGGVTNPIPLNRVVRHKGDILVGVDVSGQDYEAQSKLQQEIEEKRKRSSSLPLQILNKLIPDNLDFNYYTMLSRVSSLMIRQNSILMTQLMKPDVLVNIQMSRYGGFDYDKSEKLIAIGRKKTQQALDQY
jgi:NTE family protein